jgi:hypothetical protein
VETPACSVLAVLKTLSDNLASDIGALQEIIPETQLVIRKAQTLLDASPWLAKAAWVYPISRNRDDRLRVLHPAFNFFA